MHIYLVSVPTSGTETLINTESNTFDPMFSPPPLWCLQTSWREKLLQADLDLPQSYSNQDGRAGPVVSVRVGSRGHFDIRTCFFLMFDHWRSQNINFKPKLFEIEEEGEEGESCERGAECGGRWVETKERGREGVTD